MKSTALFAGLVCFYLNFVAGNSCGGLLEGEQGRFRLENDANQERPKISSSSCIWILQLHYENDIRFTLDALTEDAVLNVYPEDQLTSCSLSTYTKLNSTQVGSSVDFLGKTLIVVLHSSSASVVFSWHFIANEKKNRSVSIMKNSDYIDSPNGLLEWAQVEAEERVTWGIHSNANFHIKWNVDVATSCNASDSCACFYFALFQLTSEGVLSEALRTCGQSSEGQITGISGLALVLIKVNAKVEARKAIVSWGIDVAATKPPVTQPPVTEPPVSAATGLFAATTTGLISLDLQTLEATQLNSEYVCAVAVNKNLSKVYWSEISGSSRIMRSNFDGSGKEVIVPQTGHSIYMLAIDEASGNVYFALWGSQEINVCNALGQNCAVIISDPLFVDIPIGIALDWENGVMYWSKRPKSLVRANLDGSNATIISTEFNNLHGITLLRPSKNVLYYADYSINAIGTIDVNGGNKRTLVELEGKPGTFGIQVDAHKIYIGTWTGSNIQSFNRVCGQELTTIFNSTGNVRNLALFSAPA